MEKNPALAAAFRRIALGFLIESIAFYLIFVPVVEAAEPFVLLIGAAMMMSGFYRAAREVSGFKNPLYLKIIVVALLFARLVMIIIFGDTFGLGLLINAAQVLLDLACLHYICLAVPVLIPATNRRATDSVRGLATSHAALHLCVMLPFEGFLGALLPFAFLIIDLIFRIKYILYLRSARRAV